MKFCPNCGTQLQVQNQKFCPECGINLQAASSPSNSKQSTNAKDDISQPYEPKNEEEPDSVKLNTYDLGVRLENTTALIFEKMGYSVEKRRKSAYMKRSNCRN